MRGWGLPGWGGPVPAPYPQQARSPPPTAKGFVCINSQLPHSTGRDTKAQRRTEGAGGQTASTRRHHVGPRPSSSGQGSACPGSAARPPPAAHLSAGTILAPGTKGTNRATGSRIQRPQNQDTLWPTHASLKLRRRWKQGWEERGGRSPQVCGPRATSRGAGADGATPPTGREGAAPARCERSRGAPFKGVRTRNHSTQRWDVLRDREKEKNKYTEKIFKKGKAWEVGLPGAGPMSPPGAARSGANHSVPRCVEREEKLPLRKRGEGSGLARGKGLAEASSAPRKILEAEPPPPRPTPSAGPACGPKRVTRPAPSSVKLGSSSSTPSYTNQVSYYKKIT